jgi:hypothetical protein
MPNNPSPLDEWRERYGYLIPTVIERTITLLSDRRRWTTSTLARTATGKDVQPTDLEAVRWCAVGAIQKCAFDVYAETYGELNTAPDIAMAGTLYQIAQIEARQHIREAAVALTKSADVRHIEITSINDHSGYGGYQAVIAGLCKAVGKEAPVEPHVRWAIERNTKRSEAARKGWATRRENRLKALHQARIQREADLAQAMTFGGTIVAAPDPSAPSCKTLTVPV